MHATVCQQCLCTIAIAVFRIYMDGRWGWAELSWAAVCNTCWKMLLFATAPTNCMAWLFCPRYFWLQLSPILSFAMTSKCPTLKKSAIRCSFNFANSSCQYYYISATEVTRENETEKSSTCWLIRFPSDLFNLEPGWISRRTNCVCSVCISWNKILHQQMSQ